MKKPGASSTGKAGLGSIGKSGFGSTGKSGIGSTGKSGISSTSKSGGLLGSSGKSSLGSTSKSGLGYTSQSVKPSSKSGSSLISKSASPKASKSFDFIPGGKPKSLAPLSPKSYPSSSTDGYGNPKSAKSSTTFGIIWIPNKKRNKKKDIVLNSNNDTHRIRERSPSFYKFMSGDSHDQPHKKEEGDLLVVPDRKTPSGTIAVATALSTTAADLPTENAAATALDDKQQLIGQETEVSKEAAGDSKDDDHSDEDQDYLNNDGTVRKNLPDTLSEKDTFGDKVDSVYLRPPPAHKARSTASRTEEEESCGMKCLYFTLQCCDCVLM